jgi:protein-disulfide isomerase
MKYSSILALSIVFIGLAGASHGGFDDKSDPVIGDDDAEVTMEVWCDFQGPYCKQFYNNAFQQIQSEYVDHGDVKVVWKDRPFDNMHPWSTEAAKVMECVHRESDSAYWEVTEKVFQNQDSITNETVQEDIIGYAEESNIEEEELNTCVSGNASDEVRSDVEEAESRNISATPTVIIKEQTLEGAKPFSEFKTVIDSELDGNQDQEESPTETPENKSDSDRDAEELEERLDGNSTSNVTALKERLNEQQEEINELEEQQNTIISILDRIIGALGL